MAVRLRPRTAVLVLVGVLVLGAMASAVVSTMAAGSTYNPDDDMHIVYDRNGEPTYLWAYTSPERTFPQRTLAINLVVYGDTDTTYRFLTEVAEWNLTLEEEQDVDPAEGIVTINATGTPLRPADGAVRYVYVSQSSGEGIWLAESYQLHDGDYLGSRNHLRAYESPTGDDWTAFQAHREHWDWFQLRHVVDSIEESQRSVERKFMDHGFISRTFRIHVGNDYGSDSDGWMTVVEFRPLEEFLWVSSILSLLLLSVTLRTPNSLRKWQPQNPQTKHTIRLIWFAAILTAFYLAIRLAAILIEHHTTLPPLHIARGFYPILFLGFPVLSYGLARKLPTSFAFAGAVIGFGMATLVDYTYLGVMVLPLEVLVHRAAIALALGLIAAGASVEVREQAQTEVPIKMGILLYLAGMLFPVIRFLPLPG